jgi:phage replication O-like protein O
MADPQWENGYTKIANDIQEALARIRIPGEARQVLDFILRKTYGWNQKWECISLTQFVLGTNMHKSEVIRAIKKLLLMNLIGKKANASVDKQGNLYMFNKDFDTWKPLAKKQPPHKEGVTFTPIIVGEKANNLKERKKVVNTNTKKERKNNKTIKKGQKIDFKEFTDYFTSKFFEIKHQHYLWPGKLYQRWCAALTTILHKYTPEVTKAAMVGFIKTEDSWFIKQVYPPEEFLKFIQRKNLEITRRENKKIINNGIIFDAEQKKREEIAQKQRGVHKDEN